VSAGRLEQHQGGRHCPKDQEVCVPVLSNDLSVIDFRLAITYGNLSWVLIASKAKSPCFFYLVFLAGAVVRIVFIFAGLYCAFRASSSQGTSMTGTMSRTSSKRGFECGASSSIPTKDARGKPRLVDSRFSEP
jgi:hypothetical protein